MKETPGFPVVPPNVPKIFVMFCTISHRRHLSGTHPVWTTLSLSVVDSYHSHSPQVQETVGRKGEEKSISCVRPPSPVNHCVGRSLVTGSDPNYYKRVNNTSVHIDAKFLQKPDDLSSQRFTRYIKKLFQCSELINNVTSYRQLQFLTGSRLTFVVNQVKSRTPQVFKILCNGSLVLIIGPLTKVSKKSRRKQSED